VTIWSGTRRSIDIILEAKIKSIFEHAEQLLFRVMRYKRQSRDIMHPLKEYEFREF
jgi:hypothetical protein